MSKICDNKSFCLGVSLSDLFAQLTPQILPVPCKAITSSNLFT